MTNNFFKNNDQEPDKRRRSNHIFKNKKAISGFYKILITQIIICAVIILSAFYVKFYSVNLFNLIKDQTTVMINESTVVDNLFKKIDEYKDKIPVLKDIFKAPIEDKANDVLNRLEENIENQYSGSTEKSSSDVESSDAQSKEESSQIKSTNNDTKQNSEINLQENNKTEYTIIKTNQNFYVASQLTGQGGKGEGDIKVSEDGKKEIPKNVSLSCYSTSVIPTLPVSGNITSNFDFRTNPVTKDLEFHPAIDIASPEGTRIKAFLAGEVKETGKNDIFGNYIILKHSPTTETFYAHLNEIFVTKGMKLKQNETIGVVGSTGISTGNHLHFEIIIDNKKVNPEYIFKKHALI